MNSYDILKVIHILSVCLMIGATAINGLLHALVIKGNSPLPASQTLHNIMQVNRLIMAPGFVGIIVSGLWLIQVVGFAVGDVWLLTSIILTAVLILAFGLGYRVEARLERIADTANNEGQHGLPGSYRRLFGLVTPIGGGATIISIIIVYLMVAKPM
ncbi:DUF2269 family protein [Rhizobium sp. L1K21]|uniref:DUF2269 family protein n=1 Tax=Rhizobium sp. L1K21 TaxID=2954933 RepID=UPI002093649A|nr:DUF2269 family protein [Rhizobium sp. L1K21]MCO6186799.1 DUF2269 domain-containing protein [Rhizobium sp. L1K21]